MKQNQWSCVQGPNCPGLTEELICMVGTVPLTKIAMVCMCVFVCANVCLLVVCMCLAVTVIRMEICVG